MRPRNERAGRGRRPSRGPKGAATREFREADAQSVRICEVLQ